MLGNAASCEEGHEHKAAASAGRAAPGRGRVLFWSVKCPRKDTLFLPEGGPAQVEGWLSSGLPRGKSSFCSCCGGEEAAGSAAKNRCFLPGKRANGKAEWKDVHVSEPGMGGLAFCVWCKRES